jgi:DNA polymerase-3 subunit delta
LVVVEGLLRRSAGAGRAQSKAAGQAEAAEAPAEGEPAAAGKALEKTLLAYLDRVPETTELVCVEEELLSGGAIIRRLLELQRAGRGQIVACVNPRRNELPEWIRARAQRRKVKLDASAVADLAEFVGDDLRQLDQELIKLRDYAADGRPIARADVRRLVPATRAANVFDLVEALGAGDGATAGRLLQHALDADGEQPLRLLALIARQYRLLIQAKALQAQGLKPPEVARELSVPEWTAPKLLTQAGRHSFARLEQAMERIAAADEAIKTGKLTDREALDVLLAELVMDK